MAGTKFKKVREKKGISQGKLAKITGVSPATIKAYDQGYRNIDEAKIKTVAELSSALACGITDILEDEELIKKIKS